MPKRGHLGPQFSSTVVVCLSRSIPGIRLERELSGRVGWKRASDTGHKALTPGVRAGLMPDVTLARDSTQSLASAEDEQAMAHRLYVKLL